MFDLATLGPALTENWPVWFVTITLIVAAVIDGKQLKVPNWITFPMIISGWVYCAAFGPDAGFSGLLFSLGGTVVGLLLLLPAYAIGGMGAGDVKLMAGIGAWIGSMDTFFSFGVSAIVGGIIAVAMVLLTKSWDKHRLQFFTIWNEIKGIKSPEKLAVIAAERKPTMLLLPYGIPIAIGTIGYFATTGMLV